MESSTAKYRYLEKAGPPDEQTKAMRSRISKSRYRRFHLMLCLSIAVALIVSFYTNFFSGAVCFLLACTGTRADDLPSLPTDRPLIIAHRGSSGMRPEHTVAAYELAIEQGADIIECDVVVTKDMKLICSHDSWLNDTTDVHEHLEFEDRIQTYLVPDQARRITDYFSIDFTLEELMTLRRVQARSYRDQSFNGQFKIPSFDDYVAVAKSSKNNRTIGIYPECKTPKFFNNYLKQFGTTFEDLMLDALKQHKYTTKDSPCFLQSFDLDSLKYFANHTDVKLVYLLGATITDKQMEECSSYISGLGPSKSAIVTVNPATNRISSVTNFMQRAKKYNYMVHPYTFRNEYQFLAYDYGSDPYREYEQFVDLGVDGLFTDFPWSFANYLEFHKLRNGASTFHFNYALLTLSVSVLLSFI